MRIVVLMGGNSTERDVSLATGRGVARALSSRGHDVIPLDAADGRRLSLPDLENHRIGETPAETAGASKARGPVMGGPPGERNLALTRSPDLGRADAVFVALHGGMGEDGTLQGLLDLARIPYTGSGMLASALAMDKARAKMIFRAAGVPAPGGSLLESREAALDPDALGGYPLVVKPNAQGSSVGVHIVAEADELPAALDDAFQYGPVLVEEFIPGREVTVAVLGGRALPVVEIIPEAGFYDYRHKYTKGHTRYQVPADLPEDVAAEAARLGELAFVALGCAGVARVDFRLSPAGRLYCLEVNTVPGMTETSLVPMAAKAAGMSYETLVERLVELARER
jgi:D-alanine-D-alanine ligase